MKKAMVISHERSGTSFLMNTIAGNYPEYLPEQGTDGKLLRVDVDGSPWNFADPVEMKKFLSDSRFHDIPLRNIFKSHHPYIYFSPVWEYLQEQFHVFYIYRDGRDVQTSYWRHIRKQGFWWGPTTFTVGEFMRATPIGAACRYHRPRPPSNMAQRWNDHIVSWMKTRFSGVCYISYEQMSENFESVVEKIGAKLAMDSPEKILRPGLGGVHPGKGVVGNWKEHFVIGDESFFDENAHQAMKLIRGG